MSAARRRKNRVVFKNRPGDNSRALVAEERCVPANVHTHARQPTQPIETFDALLRREPMLAETNNGERAYAMADYCLQARRMMERVILMLESIDPSVDAPMAQLTADEQSAMKRRRAQWLEHLRGNFYALIAPPPASGGATARYSLGVQLWLLVMHANVILQQSDAVGDLFDFYPPNSAYLSRNALVIDNAPVMNYPLRTTLMALEHFVTSLDTLDRFHADYTRYAAALEHRIAGLTCHSGTQAEYNAPEWCVPKKVGTAAVEERVTEEFIIYTMCWLLTIYNYAEGWLALNGVQVLDRVTRRAHVEPIRVPAHVVNNADWCASARSMRRLTGFVCEYTHEMKAATYTAAVRMFLLQFELRPGDVDLFRVLFKTNNAHVRSVMQHDFKGVSPIARAYLRKVHHDRSVYSYVAELLQWADGDPENTRSASLSRQGFARQLVTLYALHQFIDGKFHVSFRERFWLFQRDPAMITSLERARTLRYPIIVQQFSRFSVFVPHRRDPQLDVAAVLHWRACARARRKQLPPPLSPAPPVPTESESDENVAQHARVYDCLTALDAVAVWAVWMLQMTGGCVDKDTDMRDFLLGLLGWQ